MSEFWREVLTGEDKGFQLAGHNCSTVVAGALKHGYAAQFSGRCQEPQSSGHYHA